MTIHSSAEHDDVLNQARTTIVQQAQEIAHF